jgi:hypothetical protein
MTPDFEPPTLLLQAARSSRLAGLDPSARVVEGGDEFASSFSPQSLGRHLSTGLCLFLRAVAVVWQALI